MEKEIDELKRRFIVSKEEERRRLKEALERILPLAKVTESGTVLLERRDLAQVDRVALVIAARYLAGCLVDNIRQEVSLNEIYEMAGLPNKKVASARTSELVKEGLVDNVGRGRYRARGIFGVEKILERLEAKYIKKEEVIKE